VITNPIKYRCLWDAGKESWEGGSQLWSSMRGERKVLLNLRKSNKKPGREHTE
jgi:hypothetical protein